jgi:hypothetical protein
VADFSENSDEPWGSINGGEFLDWLIGYWLLSKHSAPWSYFTFLIIK